MEENHDRRIHTCVVYGLTMTGHDNSRSILQKCALMLLVVVQIKAEGKELSLVVIDVIWTKDSIRSGRFLWISTLQYREIVCEQNSWLWRLGYGFLCRLCFYEYDWKEWTDKFCVSNMNRRYWIFYCILCAYSVHFYVLKFCKFRIRYRNPQFNNEMHFVQHTLFF